MIINFLIIIQETMPNLAVQTQCTGCTACEGYCKTRSIYMIKDQYGFVYPQVDNSSCVECGMCEWICPVLSPSRIENQCINAYASYSLTPVIRRESSSGGIFSEFAEFILDSGGVVYGACYDDVGMVRHICIKEKKGIKKLRGAKYTQSILDGCFSDIKMELETGKSVLFSGMPCQVAGLKSFLHKEYVNLFCVDFVCHGVPSPMAWEKYLQYRADIDNDGVLPEHINLRCKDSGWSRYSYSVDFEYSRGKHYLQKNNDDPFMRLFVGDYILRESCSDCQFKGFERVSDITLGDFWGIWDVAPEMDDNKGTSLVLTHSSKGENLLHSITDKIKLYKVSLDQAGQANPSMFCSAVHKPEREEVLDMIADNRFQDVVSMMPYKTKERETFVTKTKRVIRNILDIGRKRL